MTDESTHCCGGWLRCWCRQGGCGGGGAPRPHPGPASTRGTLPASPRAPDPAVPRVTAMAAVLPLPLLPLLLLLLPLPQVLACHGMPWQLLASQANSRQLRCRAAAGRIFQARNSANAQKGPLETLSPLLGVCSQAGITAIFTLPNLLLAILLKCVFQLCLKRNGRKSLFLFEPFSQA